MNVVADIPLADGRVLKLDRPRIMGILNVTPDSFSDGGEHSTEDAAVAHGLTMVREGADVLDIGGESTRPGAEAVSEVEQIARTCGVIRRLSETLREQGSEAVISIDTQSAVVAEAAIDAGAAIINDVSGARDPRLLPLAAAKGVPIVLMHMLGTPATMQVEPRYHDVVAEVRAYLLQRVEVAVQAGVRRERIVIDPGIGFGKTKQHNLQLLADLPRFVETGYPVLLGTSRKRFMGAICQVRDPQGRWVNPLPRELVSATCTTTALGVEAGVRLFRVHDVLANRQAADVAWAITQARRT
jgi:dihydropteroate synthase